MTYEVRLTDPAKKQFRKLDGHVQRMLLRELALLEKNPLPSGVRPLKGHPQAFRVRVEDYRILYEIVEDAVLVRVFKLGHRRDVYEGL